MFFKNKNNLIKQLKEEGLLEKKEVYEAFVKIDRGDFVLKEHKKEAGRNIPLSIGYGQTISQPQVVAFMISLLQPEEENKVLDIGFGSGWTTALLAEIVKPGKVYGIERVPEVYEFGKKNIQKYNFLKTGSVEVFLGDGREGKEDKAPFDRILISASDKDANLPLKLREQLKVNGRLVMPIRDSIYLFIKTEDDFEMREYGGFSFVPLV